mmetsp:Transcript_5734/g.13027  ORF Transcript_5734/g.13027 Transcript_5734/m.13027 type:complete len:247 (-) Transcript_5734:1971-2711(-)
MMVMAREVVMMLLTSLEGPLPTRIGEITVTIKRVEKKRVGGGGGNSMAVMGMGGITATRAAEILTGELNAATEVVVVAVAEMAGTIGKEMIVGGVGASRPVLALDPTRPIRLVLSLQDLEVLLEDEMAEDHAAGTTRTIMTDGMMMPDMTIVVEIIVIMTTGIRKRSLQRWKKRTERKRERIDGRLLILAITMETILPRILNVLLRTLSVPHLIIFMLGNSNIIINNNVTVVHPHHPTNQGILSPE